MTWNQLLALQFPTCVNFVKSYNFPCLSFFFCEMGISRIHVSRAEVRNLRDDFYFNAWNMQSKYELLALLLLQVVGWRCVN